jgi:hypothetical protein
MTGEAGQRIVGTTAPATGNPVTDVTTTGKPLVGMETPALTIPRIDTTAYATTEAGIDRLQRVNVDQTIA